MLKPLAAALITISATHCFAFSSINTAASFGYYKDADQNSHTPLIYSFSYNGIFESQVETTLDFFVSNDFFVNQWSVIPSQASVVIPFSQGLSEAPYKKSRIILGRQFFTEGFEIGILDGAQMPIYWGENGGFWLYGGQSHVLDLLDSTAASLMGASVFQSVFDFHLRAGFQLKQNSFSERYLYGSIGRNWEEAPLAPSFLSRIEYDDTVGTWSQSFNQLQLNLASNVLISGSHQLVKPHKPGSDQNQFVYFVLAQSAQEIDQGALYWQIADQVAFHTFARMMRYKTGTQMEWANQQEASLPITLGRHTLTPLAGHIQGYGGELWDMGLSLKSRLGESTVLDNQFSAAFMDKVNNITGWAYQWRSGIGYNLGPRWVSSTWVEVEKNHLFVFDARIMANVTYFN